jgi:4-amino-4-deoxy-L-arabinose transferase-like glycosyltransferase
LSRERRRDSISLVVALAAAAAAMGFWFAWARHAAPNAGDLLRDEYAYVFEISKNPFFYVIMLGLMFPWTFWLFGGILWPAWRKESPQRPAGWFIWTWFIAVWILLSLSPVKNKRYLAPLFPAAGLLAAYVWTEWQSAPGAQTDRPRVRRLARLHWAALTLATFLLPVFAALEPLGVSRALLRRATFGEDAWVVWALAPLALLPCWFWGWIAYRRGRPNAAAICTAAWFSAAATFGFFAYARTPRQQFPFRADAEQLAAWARRAPLCYISRFQPPYHEAMPGHELLIYFRGIVPATSLDELLARAARGDTLLALTRLEPADEQKLAEAGFRYVRDIRDGRRPDWRLMVCNVPRAAERSLNR